MNDKQNAGGEKTGVKALQDMLGYLSMSKRRCIALRQVKPLIKEEKARNDFRCDAVCATAMGSQAMYVATTHNPVATFVCMVLGFCVFFNWRKVRFDDYQNKKKRLGYAMRDSDEMHGRIEEMLIKCLNTDEPFDMTRFTEWFEGRDTEIFKRSQSVYENFDELEVSLDTSVEHSIWYLEFVDTLKTEEQRAYARTFKLPDFKTVFSDDDFH